MRRTLLLVASLAVGAWSEPPSPPPGPPSRATESKPAQVPKEVFRFQLQPGWNGISFPYSKVSGTRGFAYKLLDSQNNLVDPLLQPGRLVAGQGYWAYSDQPREVTAWGVPLAHDTVIPLTEGWNLIGSPFPQAVVIGQITLSDGIQVNRIWEEVLPRWMLPSLYLTSSPGDSEVSLTEADSQLQPGRAYWARAFKPVTLRINNQAEVPRITGFRSSKPGEWVVEGTNFGNQNEGRLVLDNHSASMLEIREWSPTRIVLAPPPSLPPHQLTVVSGGAASPRVPSGTWQKRWSGTPGLAVRVVNEAAEPVPYATVMIDGWQTARTNARGWVRFDNVEAGQHRLRIAQDSYLTLNTSVQMNTAARRVQAKLYSPPASMWLRATTTSDGFRPVRIEAYQRTDPMKRQVQTWYFEQATPYVDFSWTQIPCNVNYKVEVTWRDALGNEKLLRLDRKLGYYGLQETYYNYWTLWPPPY